MKTIVHVGQHKTGTTSIQRFLRDHHDVLISKGIYVPVRIGECGDPSHYLLNVCALAPGRFSLKKEKVLRQHGEAYLLELCKRLPKDIAEVYSVAEEKRCHTVLWSNEGLYLLNSVAEYRSLTDLFFPYSEWVEAVCCFRDLESFRFSYEKQLIKKGVSRSLDPDSYRYISKDSWLYDYDRKKKLLDAVFDKTVYFEYDSGNNVQSFLRALGLEGFDAGDYRLNVTRKMRNTIKSRVKRVLRKVLRS